MRLTCIALCALLLGSVFGISQAGEAKKKWRVGFSQCNLGEPWRANMFEDLKKEVAKYPDDIELIHKDAPSLLQMGTGSLLDVKRRGVWW